MTNNFDEKVNRGEDLMCSRCRLTPALSMVTVTEHFSVVRIYVGCEKNMNFFVIPKVEKIKMGLKSIALTYLPQIQTPKEICFSGTTQKLARIILCKSTL